MDPFESHHHIDSCKRGRYKAFCTSDRSRMYNGLKGLALTLNDQHTVSPRGFSVQAAQIVPARIFLEFSCT
jgi:hypothetical protein